MVPGGAGGAWWCLVVPVVRGDAGGAGGEEPRVVDWARKKMNEEQRGARCDAGGAGGAW